MKEKSKYTLKKLATKEGFKTMKDFGFYLIQLYDESEVIRPKSRNERDTEEGMRLWKESCKIYYKMSDLFYSLKFDNDYRKNQQNRCYSLLWSLLKNNDKEKYNDMVEALMHR